jgi:hypothetical protein
MLPRRWARASPAKFLGEHRPELEDPSPHRLVGDIQTALSEQIFCVVITERETRIEPNGVPDDRRWILMAGERDRSCTIVPINWKRTIVAVTKHCRECWARSSLPLGDELGGKTELAWKGRDSPGSRAHVKLGQPNAIRSPAQDSDTWCVLLNGVYPDGSCHVLWGGRRVCLRPRVALGRRWQLERLACRYAAAEHRRHQCSPHPQIRIEG